MPESAKQIGQSRLHAEFSSIMPRHACCLCSGHRPQSSGQPSTVSVWSVSGIVPGLLKRSESMYMPASPYSSASNVPCSRQRLRRYTLSSRTFTCPSTTTLQTGQIDLVYSRNTSSRSALRARDGSARSGPFRRRVPAGELTRLIILAIMVMRNPPARRRLGLMTGLGAPGSELLWSGPVEAEVLARPPGPAPFEAECLHFVLLGDCPRSHRAGSGLGTWRIVELHARSLGSRRTRQRFGAASGFPWDRDTPVAKIIGDLEVDRDELDPADVVDHPGEAGRPAARLPPKDRLERLALALVGSFVDEEAHRRLGAGPQVPRERHDSDEVQLVKCHISVASLAYVAGDHPVALVLVRGLAERTPARDPAPADVEHIARQPPTRNFGHRFVLSIGPHNSAILPPRRTGINGAARGVSPSNWKVTPSSRDRSRSHVLPYPVNRERSSMCSATQVRPPRP